MCTLGPRVTSFKTLLWGQSREQPEILGASEAGEALEGSQGGRVSKCHLSQGSEPFLRGSSSKNATLLCLPQHTLPPSNLSTHTFCIRLFCVCPCAVSGVFWRHFTGACSDINAKLGVFVVSGHTAGAHQRLPNGVTSCGYRAQYRTPT